MHDEYFQIAFCSFTNAHWNAPASFRDFGRITFVIQRDDQTGLAFGVGTVTFKLTLRHRAQLPLARLDVVDRDWRFRLPGLPFLAAPSLRNEPARLDQRFSEDRLPALRVGVDATLSSIYRY